MIFDLFSALLNGVIKIVLRLPIAIVETVLNAFGIDTSWFKYIYSVVDVIGSILKYTIVPILAGIAAYAIPTLIAGMLALRIWTAAKWVWDSIMWAKDAAWKAINGIIKIVPIILGGLWTFISTMLVPFIISALAAIPVIGWIILAIAGLITLVVVFWDEIKGVLVGIYDWTIGVFKASWDFIVNIVTSIWWAVQYVWGILKNIGNIIMYYVTLPMRLGLNAIGNSVPWIGGAWGDWFLGAVGVTAPQLAEGGIATKEVLAQVGEAGDSEAIIPLNEAGMAFMLKIMAPLFAGLMISLISPILGAIGLGWLIGGAVGFLGNMFGSEEEKNSNNKIEKQIEQLNIEVLSNGNNILSVLEKVDISSMILEKCFKVIKFISNVIFSALTLLSLIGNIFGFSSIVGGILGSFSGNKKLDFFEVLDKISEDVGFIKKSYMLDKYFSNEQQEPMMAVGGIVTRQTRATIGEAGPEAVIPLNSSGFNYITNIFNSLGEDKEIEGMSGLNNKLDKIISDIGELKTKPTYIENGDNTNNSPRSSDPVYEFSKFLATGIVADGEI
jgi:hypothetical protein